MAQWLGQRLSEVCPELGLQTTLRLGVQELEKIERVRGKALIVNRIPILEQGVLTSAVISCQDPISIQRVDRQIRTRIKPHAQGQRHELAEFLGESPQARQVRALAHSCARSHATVLLLGESGTGKELVAQAIHFGGNRAHRPFVAVNCGAIPAELIESELFGHVKGAFTGAVKDRAGLFAEAHRGTIFLDEVATMPLSAQVRLLRVLQEREVQPLGGGVPIKVDVRVVAADSFGAALAYFTGGKEHNVRLRERAMRAGASSSGRVAGPSLPASSPDAGAPSAAASARPAVRAKPRSSSTAA